MPRLSMTAAGERTKASWAWSAAGGSTLSRSGTGTSWDDELSGGTDEGSLEPTRPGTQDGLCATDAGGMEDGLLTTNAGGGAEDEPCAGAGGGAEDGLCATGTGGGEEDGLCATAAGGGGGGGGWATRAESGDVSSARAPEASDVDAAFGKGSAALTSAAAGDDEGCCVGALELAPLLWESRRRAFDLLPTTFLLMTRPLSIRKMRVNSQTRIAPAADTH
jgi:hypothetical protein